MFATNPENAKIIEALKTALSAIPIGGTAAYISLSKTAGLNVQFKARHLLKTAREHAEKELGCLYECARNVGIKRLNATDAPEVGLPAIRKTRRIAKRGNRRLERINVNSLSNAEQKRVIAYSSMLGAIAMLSDGNK